MSRDPETGRLWKRNPERSTGACLTALCAAGLLVVSLSMPWFEYTTTTGRKTAPGGYNEPANTEVERHRVTYTPGTMEGDVAPDDPAKAQALLDQLWWAVVVAAALFGLVALLEAPGMPRILPRWATLVVLVAAAAGIAVAAWLGWDGLHRTLAAQGVTWQFTYFLVPDEGYTRTTMLWGWAAATLAAPFALGAFLFKFQTGADPEGFLRALRARGRPG